jgi:hypothetical protein
MSELKVIRTVICPVKQKTMTAIAPTYRSWLRSSTEPKSRSRTFRASMLGLGVGDSHKFLLDIGFFDEDLDRNIKKEMLLRLAIFGQ